MVRAAAFPNASNTDPQRSTAPTPYKPSPPQLASHALSIYCQAVNTYNMPSEADRDHTIAYSSPKLRPQLPPLSTPTPPLAPLKTRLYIYTTYRTNQQYSTMTSSFDGCARPQQQWQRQLSGRNGHALPPRLPPTPSMPASYFPNGAQSIKLATYISTLSDLLSGLSYPSELLAAFEAFDNGDDGQIGLGELKNAYCIRHLSLGRES
ncbi:uncharacterized protein BDR25DRAFT_347714 [Lindgomyces ingoldianus]|uniref:Uncharacterized protein n=1 Tax=Lindgomyces ingoldianus TaxID=673940 RepID=A0ACB6Q6N7_9PLEO|nr:uncharacterized protein BDR25DRAFT_347714 [Lindgomyces ingoldianus]KAF2462521.1 hypothetical protein BDR25DRAFT_347714 [Lindgomyces ingoldianus]